MDTRSQVDSGSSEKGMVIVYVAVLITMIFAFLALAFDVGYMDIAKTQLQTAADSAALAGATYLPDQNLARFKAMSSAHRNITAGSPVTILNNGSNALSDANDITVGNYNRLLNPAYLPGGDPGGTPPRPINAVQVQARRTQDTSLAAEQSKIDLFFGQLFGHPTMGVSATAIAQRLPHAGAHFLLSRTVCPPLPSEGYAEASISPPRSLAPGIANMAWSSLLDPSTSATDVKDLVCGPIPDVEVCGRSVYTTNGTASTDFKNMESVFYDPYYDTKNKTFNGDGSVATWTVIVPVANVDDPTNQPGAIPVLGYAKIRMIRACGSGVGGGSACMPYGSPKGKAAVCSSGENDIVIDWIQCVTCDASPYMWGAVPTLAQ